MGRIGCSLVLCAALSIGLGGPATAFEPEVAALVSQLKPNKLVPGDTLGGLMAGSRIWCYDAEGTTCRWTDRYLAADATGAEFELSYMWTPDTAVTVTNGLVIAGDSACYSGIQYVDTLTATRDGQAVSGKPLDKIKGELRAVLEPTATVEFCFDYSFVRADERASTVTLLQREYSDGVYGGAAEDVEVVLHFDAASAEALTLREQLE